LIVVINYAPGEIIPLRRYKKNPLVYNPLSLLKERTQEKPKKWGKRSLGGKGDSTGEGKVPKKPALIFLYRCTDISRETLLMLGGTVSESLSGF